MPKLQSKVYWWRYPYYLGELEERVRAYLASNDSSHDINHVIQVVKVAKYILQREIIKNPYIIEEIAIVAALCHEIGDRKYIKKGENAKEHLEKILEGLVSPRKQRVIIDIVTQMSYSKEIKRVQQVEELEELMHQDRLVQIKKLLQQVNYTTQAGLPRLLMRINELMRLDSLSKLRQSYLLLPPSEEKQFAYYAVTERFERLGRLAILNFNQKKLNLQLIKACQAGRIDIMDQLGNLGLEFAWEIDQLSRIQKLEETIQNWPKIINTPEFKIAHDADYVEANGQKGYLRTIQFGENIQFLDKKGRLFTNIPNQLDGYVDFFAHYTNKPEQTAEKYNENPKDKKEEDTFDHIVGKLLKLKFLMKTETGRVIATHLHDQLLYNMYNYQCEWNCNYDHLFE